MAELKRPVVRIRAEDHVERLAAALVHEEVAFDVRPEANGWWAIRATIDKGLLESIEQATRFDRG